MEYGLIGKKLGHSFSKEIHEQISDYKYELCELTEEEFTSFMEKKDFKAINVTIPYKQKVIPYLSYIDPIALEIGAVNTIVNNNGKLYGYNTDYLGLKALIEKKKIHICNKKVLILGYGGTAKTAEAVVKHMNCKEVIFVNHTQKDNTISYEDAIKNHSDSQIIINTTPCGMYPNNDDLIIDIKYFDKLCGVIDVIYNPLRTKLIQKAKKRNLKNATGLYMLVAQAIYASSIFLEKEIDLDLIDKVYEDLYKAKRNIVLIGMPSSGKTTIGKMLAKKLKRDFFDSDKELEKALGCEISSFLNDENEEVFRNFEEEVIRNLSMKSGVVIATGGGVIKREINIKRLKQNGKVIFIDRNLEHLVPTSSRPLSSTLDSLKQLYKERYQLYVDAADIHIENNDEDLFEIVSKIKNEV